MPHQQKYEWDYTYGAVEVSRAGSVFCFQSTVHEEASGKFPGPIAAHDPAAIHGIIQDGAGFHLPENDPRLPANARVIPLPADSPELNPVERRWDHMKDAICNRVFATVEKWREALAGWLEEFWSDGARALSLIGRGWRLASANAGVKC